MAINTGGFQTNVIPNYTPVDPNLVAFNPGAITAGIGQSFDAAKGLAELKLMRQTHEENAKMSVAKNKLLQAQADNQRILADYEAGIAPKKTESANLGYDAASAVSRNTMAVQPGVTEKTLLDQRNESLLAPGAFDLAKGAQNAAIKAQPYLSNATVFNAQAAEGAAKFGLGQQGTTQEITAAQNESNLRMTPDATRANELKAKANVLDAGRNLAKTQAEFLSGTTTAEKLEEAKVTLTNSHAKLADAQGKSLSDKNAALIAKITNGKDFLNSLNNKIFRLGNTAILDPLGTGQKMKLSEISDRLFDVRPDGTSVPRSMPGFNFSGQVANLNQNDRLLLNSYLENQKKAAKLEDDMMVLYDMQHEGLTPTVSTDDFGVADPRSSKSSAAPASGGTWVIINGKWVLRP
jgi:hypothetical protein